ncbi:MAG: 16S/23S rRNA (cytidine-2'-O)-methyltransferase TlyA [Myxococcota bacterium]|nr:16S/23S rRNA (cytidine-2'-O)-methyltransferase TlyA [Myxococcota bacterium]
MSRKRLDIVLVERGLAPSREKAQALIMSGAVFANGQRADKPGTPIREDQTLEIRGERSRYVSRGGDKLEGALNQFHLDVTGLTCLDVGASTGGFTDCLLQHGAARVYAIDTGRGQLDARLRADPRVVSREKVNARHLQPGDLPELVDLIVADVSFISLRLVIPPVRVFLKPGGKILALIKPQFEAGPKRVGKGGVIRDETIRQEVIQEVLGALLVHGDQLLGVADSVLPGADGNREVFALLRRKE